MNRLLCLLTLVLATLPCLADPFLDDFFDSDHHNEKFQALLDSGQIAKFKAALDSNCALNTQDPTELAACQCNAKGMKALDDREFYFMSVIAYQDYMQKVEATEANDQAALDALKVAQAKRPNYTGKIEARCESGL